MAIKTARASGNALVSVDHSACTACGLCVKVCKGAGLAMSGGRVTPISEGPLGGCMACGQCVAVCPRGCISVEGRDLHASDALELSPAEARAGFEALRNLMLARRSIRDFRDEEIDRETIEKILDAASTAPMGLPPTDVSVLLVAGRARVREFSDDLLEAMKSWRWMSSPISLALMRPFIGRENYEMMKDFLGPLLQAFAEKRREGVDWLLYGAPLAAYFYTSLYADPADPVIAATYAMLAGESLGLGTIMIGTASYAIRYSKKLQARYSVPRRHRPGILVLFGKPVVTYRRAVRRRFANVTRIGPV